MVTCGRQASRPKDMSLVPTLDKVSLDIAVVLGTTTMPIHQVLRLGRGAIIELDASEEDEVQILANNFPVAKGTVVVSGNRIAVEVKDMLPRAAGSALISGPARWPLSRPNRFVTCARAIDAVRQPAFHLNMRPWRNW